MSMCVRHACMHVYMHIHLYTYTKLISYKYLAFRLSPLPGAFRLSMFLHGAAKECQKPAKMKRVTKRMPGKNSTREASGNLLSTRVCSYIYIFINLCIYCSCIFLYAFSFPIYTCICTLYLLVHIHIYTYRERCRIHLSMHL